MNNQDGDINLNDLLDAYLTEIGSPCVDLLTEWIKKYPQYEDELIEFTAAWSQVELLPKQKHSEIDWTKISLHNKKIAKISLDKFKRKHAKLKTEKPEIAGLVKEGKKNGYTVNQLAVKTELSTMLVHKLDRRLISYFSIPLKGIEVFANILNREITLIALYLNQPPVLPSRASYKANQAPNLPEKEDFFDAVRNDQEINENYRVSWLELEKSKE